MIKSLNKIDNFNKSHCEKMDNAGAYFEQCYPRLSKPYIVGYMSVDVQREYRADLSELKFVTHIPKGKISFNLNHNVNNAIKRTTEDNVEKIDLLLKYVIDQNDRTHVFSPLPHFIMYRRSMISVFNSAIGNANSCIIASLFSGNIYLCNVVAPERNKKFLTDEHLRFMAWGYKFEQYMNADLPELKPNIEEPVVENAEFSLYYRAKLGSHELLYGAQIDGVLATNGKTLNPPQNADYDSNLKYLRSNEYVELKTNKEINPGTRQEYSFKRYKLLQSWAQCYLAGLQGLIVGYRNDHGIVQRLQWFSTNEIVQYCQDVWEPSIVLEFLDYFLTFVKTTFKDHTKKTLGANCDFKNIGPITLQFDIGTDRTIRVTDKCEHILPEWFVTAMAKEQE